jgi:hypothetical protein
MKLASLVALALACGRRSAPEPYTPAAIRPLPLPSIGLTFDAPDAAKIGTAVATSVEVDWPGVKLAVRLKGDALFEADLATAGKTAGGFAQVIKQETTVEGWELRYDETLGGSTLYNVTIDRTIGDIEVQCKGAGNTTVAEAQLAAACASLRK